MGSNKLEFVLSDCQSVFFRILFQSNYPPLISNNRLINVSSGNLLHRSAMNSDKLMAKAGAKTKVKAAPKVGLQSRQVAKHRLPKNSSQPDRFVACRQSRHRPGLRRWERNSSGAGAADSAKVGVGVNPNPKLRLETGDWRLEMS